MSLMRSLGLLVAVSAAAGFLARVASAQDTPPSRASGSANGGEFFGRGTDAIDFWGEAKRKSPSRAKPSETSPGATESIWAEPRPMPDGRIAVYVPPKEVLRFLDDPTRENAQAYVAWQEARRAKLKAAMETLRQLQAEREKAAGGTKRSDAADEKKKPDESKTEKDKKPDASTRSDEGKPTSDAKTPANANEILYFKKKDCPYCAEEDKAFGELAKLRPGLAVRTVTPSDAPDLWKEYGITVVPSLVLSGAGGKKYLVQGYVGAERLHSLLSEVNREKK